MVVVGCGFGVVVVLVGKEIIVDGYEGEVC